MTIFDCQRYLSEPMQHLLLLEVHLVAILVLLSPLLFYLFVDVSTSCMLGNNAKFIIIIFIDLFKLDDILMLNKLKELGLPQNLSFSCIVK